MKTYDVTVEREGRWWVFRIPELGAVGQAHKLSEVDFEARGIISAWEEVPLDTVAVKVTSDSYRDALDEWAAAEKEEEAARRAQDQAARKRRAIVGALRAERMPAVDVGLLLGISKQRVYQIEKAEKAAPVDASA